MKSEDSLRSSNQCIHQLFESQVSQSPDKIAAISTSQQLTYRELNSQANQVAHYLLTLGAKSESLVGVCVDRSIQMIAALMGILKAGAAYVPLDPQYPTERLGFIIEDTRIPLLISQSSMGDTLPSHGAKTILLDTDWAEIAKYPTANPECNVKSDDLAYVIYTSGSTGRPKGVAIEHRNAIDLAQWSKTYFEPDCWSGVLASTSICFDLSIFEIFVTLGLGGKLILAENALELPHLKAADQVKLINTVPSAIDALNTVNGIPQSVHTINLAGEPLQNALVQKLYQLHHVKAVYNLYGPSEDTTYSTAALIPPGATGVPTIGRPLPNSQVYLLDNQMRPVLDGVEGEIFIGGAGLARGYLNRPELTAEKFIPNPFSQVLGDRLYRTGDLALYLPDGNLKFLGRIDHQVKIRGFRIELGEIEAVLMEHEALRKVIVVAREDECTTPRLLAYVVPELGRSMTPQLLHSFLSERLPVHMLPAAFVVMDELPLTPNGKIDRRALPVPQWSCREPGDFIAPASVIEVEVAEVWSRVLKIEKIGIHEAFCSLGGHSLILLHLIHEVKIKFGLEIPMAQFLETPTISGMARSIEALQQQTSSPEDIDFDQEGKLDESIVLPSLPNISVPQIFLTGATGFLGSYLLAELLQQTRGDIYCLVRATSVTEAKARLCKALQRYHLWDKVFEDRVIPVLGSLSLPRLGMRSEVFDRLSEKLEMIYHCGAWVNMVYPYPVLKASNVTGTEEVLRLASQSRVKPVHYISTVDVFKSSNTIRTIQETDPASPAPSLYSGYAKSKRVAESLLQAAQTRGIPVAIYRPSNVMGDTHLGLSSPASFVTQMIKGCLEIGASPHLEAALNLVPADYVSQAIVHLSLCSSSFGNTFNIVNPQSLMWNDLVTWMQDAGYQIDHVSYEVWCSKVLSMASTTPKNSLLLLTTLLTNQSFIQKSLGAFYFDSPDLLQQLSEAGIRCSQSQLDRLAVYFQSFYQTGLIDQAPRVLSPRQDETSQVFRQTALNR